MACGPRTGRLPARDGALRGARAASRTSRIVRKVSPPKFTESQRLPDVSFEGFARGLGLHGVAVDKPEQVGAAWDQAFAADRPTVLDFRTDPDVPPIPPHATYEQMKDAATALLKGDANRWGILKEGLMAKAREVLPGKDS